MVRVASLFVAFSVLSAPALAQGDRGGTRALGYAPATEAPAPAWEARFGLGAANPGGRESGLVNFGGEILTPRIATLNDRFANAFVPRFHLGSSLNVNGTQYAYAGATWTFDVSQSVFLEASLGAAVNNGKTGAVIPENRLNVGCNTGARSAAALGFRLSDRWSLIATLEHFSTTGCSDNPLANAGNPRGPSNFGARLGYTF
ncbi:acyloxyacyl hydrolase [Bosea sp. NPDC003192]|uniref:acyloxyacyl hydrolase n=1 Tax=Bosea sp. NPDC003192 TaxID=3390551 RepID=UPI003D08EDD4